MYNELYYVCNTYSLVTYRELVKIFMLNKKIFPIYIILALAISSNPYSTRAEESDITSQERFTQTREETFEAKDLPKAKKVTHETIPDYVTHQSLPLNIREKERISNLAANVSNRMDAAIVRFGSIIRRLEERIELMNAQNINTSDSKNSLRNATASLNLAIQNIDDIDRAVEDFVSAESPHKKWPRVKIKYKSTKQHLITTHNALRDTIESLTFAEPIL